jgi:hypothetical protein
MSTIENQINLILERLNKLEKTAGLVEREDIENLASVVVKEVVSVEKEVVKEVVPVVKEKKNNISTYLPWVGIVNENCCQGLKVNHGLYNQCQGLQDGNTEFCKACVNQGIKNGSNVPNYGTVKDRLAQPMMEYVDKKSGKECVPWLRVLKKMNIDKDAALEYAKEHNITIPDEHLVNTEKRRGRPKKNSTTETTVTDTDEEGGDVSPKKRGRPKKEKKEMKTVAGDDLIANMVANLNSNPINSNKSLDTLEIDSGELHEEVIEEDDSTEVRNLMIDCINYLVDEENTVYDIETQDEIGTYNPETNSIVKDGL